MRSKLKQSGGEDEIDSSNFRPQKSEDGLKLKEEDGQLGFQPQTIPQSYADYTGPSQEVGQVPSSFGESSQAPNSDLTYLANSELMEWIMNNRDVGLDFVGPWTELIEQQLEDQHFDFNDGLNFTNP